MALSPADMDLFSFGVDIHHLKGEGLTEGQAHGIGKDMSPEELQSVSIYLYGAPGMGLNQV
jgi:hypothetical protein